jgi:hypothetical protein
MKKIALISAIALSGLLYNSANAQVRIHLGFNFGPRPVYVPARVVVQDQPVVYAQPANYDGDENYYYLPEVDAYYSIPEQCYYYNNGGRWISAAYLPGAYRDFDWRSARRYEVRAPRPFMHNDYYRTRYNGVAFNGNWNRVYNRGYANAGRFNNDQFRRDDRRFDNNRGWGGDNRRFDQNRGQRFDDNRNSGRNDQRNQRNQNFDRNGAQEHFAQNNAQRNDRGDRDNHRPGRF